MNEEKSKRELLEQIKACTDMELIQKIADFVQAEKMKVKEEQPTYNKEEVKLEDLSLEFQETIKRGEADVAAGRVHTHENVMKELAEWLGK